MGMIVNPSRFAPPAAAGHRYWRIYMTQNSGDISYHSFTDLAFRSTADGPDEVPLIGYGVQDPRALGSSHYSNYGPWLLYDDDSNSASVWHAYKSNPAWVGWDFGAGNEKNIVEIAINPRGDYPNMAPRDIKLQYSDDGVAWFDAYSWPQVSRWFKNEPRKFTVGVPDVIDVAPLYRFWRVYTTNSWNDTYLSMAEIQFRDAVGGPDLTSPADAVPWSQEKRAFASEYRTSGDWNPGKAFDDDDSSAWLTDRGANWVAWDFKKGNEKQIVEVAIRPRSNAAAMAPVNVKLQASADGQSWTDIRDFGNVTPWAENTLKVLTV